jgi:hypothetical protein
MNPLIKEIRHNPLLWLLAFVPVLFAAETGDTVGGLLNATYLIFAMTLYLLPPRSPGEGAMPHKTTERSIQRAYDESKFTSLDATAPERSLCCANFS